MAEVTAANIADILQQCTAFPGTQKINHFVFTDDALQVRGITCSYSVGKWSHFHMGYYYSPKNACVTTKYNKVQTLSELHSGQSSNHYPSTRNIFQINLTHDVGDNILIRSGEKFYLNAILFQFRKEALQ